MAKLTSMDILSKALILALVSVGGWLIFNGITVLFNLNNLSPIMMVIIGLGVVWVTAKFGFNKLIK